jgi:hypothetical protein
MTIKNNKVVNFELTLQLEPISNGFTITDPLLYSSGNQYCPFLLLRSFSRNEKVN